MIYPSSMDPFTSYAILGCDLLCHERRLSCALAEDEALFSIASIGLSGRRNLGWRNLGWLIDLTDASVGLPLLAVGSSKPGASVLPQIQKSHPS
ncbi:hypothetical protein QYF36_016569 [Acer negundo]|nr:hypothetical protein QYF36_016569 [Acer negundo]